MCTILRAQNGDEILIDARTFGMTSALRFFYVLVCVLFCFSKRPCCAIARLWCVMKCWLRVCYDLKLKPCFTLFKF